MNARQLRILGLILCLVLSGCSGYSPNENPTQSRSPTSQTEDVPTVTESEFPVNQNQTFQRVERLIQTNRTMPPVRVNEIDSRPAHRATQGGEFSELMAVNTTYPAINEAAGVTQEDLVEISYTNDASPDRIERTLAHEFVHVLQPIDLRSTLRDHTQPEYGRTTDAKFAQNSIVEGVAVDVTDEYTRTYLQDVRTHSSELQSNWENWSVGLRSYWAPYYYGQKYVESRRESGAELGDIYANPPQTAEQIIHNYAPDEEPRRHLEVNATTSAPPWDLTTEDAKGELYVRHLLEGELSTDHAKRAATGWGNDRLLSYYNRTNTGHVWMTRWDDADEAAEFEAAFARFLDRRYEENGSSWYGEEAAFRLNRTSNDTVALVAGHPSFLNVTTVATNESKTRVLVDGR